MTGVRAKVPILAWLLTALTCLLVGMVIVESRRQVVALPAAAALGVGKSVETAAPSTATPAPLPSATALLEGIRIPRSTGDVTLGVVRLTVPPGGRLPSAV